MSQRRPVGTEDRFRWQIIQTLSDQDSISTLELGHLLGTQPAHTAKILGEMEATGIVARSYGRVSRSWRTAGDEETAGSRLSKTQRWRRACASYVGGRRAAGDEQTELVRARDVVVAVDTGNTGLEVARVVAARTDGPRVLLSAHSEIHAVSRAGGAAIESLGGRYDPATRAYQEAMGGRGPGPELDARAAAGQVVNISIVVPLAVRVRADALVLDTMRGPEVSGRRALIRHGQRLVLILTEDRLGPGGHPFATLGGGADALRPLSAATVIVVYGGEGGEGLEALRALAERGLVDLRVVDLPES